jgi:hypothetical protein
MHAFEIERAQSAGSQALLLIDPMVGLPPELTLDKLRDRGGVRIDLPGREDVDSSMHCVLVPIQPGFDELLRLSAELACANQSADSVAASRQFACPAIGGWLLSSASPKAVAHHLSRCMTQRNPAGQTRYVRWGDARVLTGLWPCLDAEQRHQLMGPIDAWWTVTWQIALHKHASSQSAQAADVSSRVASQQRRLFTVEQWARVERMAASNTALERWFAALATKSRADDVDAELNAKYEAVDTAVSRAKLAGFVERDDQIVFALASVLGFDQGEMASLFNTAIAQALSDHRPLDYCLADHGLICP